MPAINTIKVRRGTAAAWTSANPTLGDGEPGYETDTGKMKIGNGSTAWTSLAYFMPGEWNWTTVTKTADESVTSSTTSQNDDHLFFTAANGVNYEIQMYVWYVSPVGGGTPDLKGDFGEDSTLRGWMAVTTISTADTITNTGAGNNQTATFNAGTATTDRLFRAWGWHLGAGGTWRFRWSQVNSNANAVTVKAGSFLRYRVM